MSKKEVLLIGLSLIVIGIAYRFIPHPANFTPIGAIAIFSSVYFSKKWSFFLPLGLMLVTDIFIGFYDFKLMAVVYVSMLVYSLLGLWAKNKTSLASLVLASMSGSIFFFLITNFAVWAFSNWYSHNLNGLMWCYALAAPFFKNTLLGDLFFTGVLFGSYAWLYKTVKCRKMKVSSKAVSL